MKEDNLSEDKDIYNGRVRASLFAVSSSHLLSVWELLQELMSPDVALKKKRSCEFVPTRIYLDPSVVADDVCLYLVDYEVMGNIFLHKPY